MQQTEEDQATVRILLIDDDMELRTLVCGYLETHGFEVTEVGDAAAARAILSREDFDIAVIDVMMPGEDGLSLARWLSSELSIGIIIASALGGETDRIIGLEVGADDYLSKPLSPRELLARIRALLRRRGAAVAKNTSRIELHFDGWRLDPGRRLLRDPVGIVTTLSDGEFGLLTAFAEQPGRVLSREELIGYAKGDETMVCDRAIDTQVSRLRRKLASRNSAEMIHTVRNEGYIFLPIVTRQRAAR